MFRSTIANASRISSTIYCEQNWYGSKWRLVPHWWQLYEAYTVGWLWSLEIASIHGPRCSLQNQPAGLQDFCEPTEWEAVTLAWLFKFQIHVWEHDSKTFDQWRLRCILCATCFRALVFVVEMICHAFLCLYDWCLNRCCDPTETDFVKQQKGFS